MLDDVSLIERWLTELHQVIADHELTEDADLLRKVSMLEIELEGLKVNLPGYELEEQTLILERHKGNISQGVLDALHSILAYYVLPDRVKGDNEPVLGHEVAQQLRAELLAQHIDVYSATERLAELLENKQDN